MLGGKQEFGRLARFLAIGRIGLEEVGGSPSTGMTFERDEAILKAAAQYDAVSATNDKNMKAAAQARHVFVLSTSWATAYVGVVPKQDALPTMRQAHVRPAAEER